MLGRIFWNDMDDPWFEVGRKAHQPARGTEDLGGVQGVNEDKTPLYKFLSCLMLLVGLYVSFVFSIRRVHLSYKLR